MFLVLVSVGPRVGAPDRRDLVPFDDDVLWTAGRGALAVDNDDVADDEPVIALAVLDAPALGLEGRNCAQKNDQNGRMASETVDFFMGSPLFI